MKREAFFNKGLFFCFVALLASCNIPPATDTAPPSISLPATIRSSVSPTTSISLPPTISPTVTPTPYSPPEHRIGIRITNGIGEFYDHVTQLKFIPRGMNYIRIGPQSTPYGQSTNYHAVFDPDKYDPSRVETALKRMHDDGYNVVRVFLSQNTIGTASDGLAPAYMKNIADFMARAQQNQIYVMFTQDWLPAGKYDAIIGRDCCSNFTLMNLNYLSPAGLEANVAFYQDFISSLIGLHAPLDAILSYELRNEMFYETNQPPLSLTQGKITAADGKTYDMASAQDKQQMTEENLVYWIDTMRGAILDKDPSALVSVGFFHPQQPNPARIGDPRLAVTEPAIWKSKADFIDLHAYPGFELGLKQYVENFGVKNMQAKPLVMGEFGGEITRFTSADAAARRFVSWQVESCQYGFDGWIFWTWDENEEPDFFNALMDNGRIEKALAPTTRPDACSAGTSVNSLRNLALNASVSASLFLPDQPPKNAIDGSPETQWGAGSHPPQWIEVNLGKPNTITSIALTVAQYPNGNTTHQVWVRGANDNARLVHEFRGNTVDNQVLEFTFAPPLSQIQFVRILTTSSSSWVSWKEIEVYGK